MTLSWTWIALVSVVACAPRQDPIAGGAAAPRGAVGIAAIGPEGGRLEVSREGALSVLTLEIPAGALNARAQVTMRMLEPAAVREDSPQSGVDVLGGYRIEVVPAELGAAVADHARLSLAIRTERLDHDRELAQRDPMRWARERLAIADEDVALSHSLDDHATGRCTKDRITSRFTITRTHLMAPEVQLPLPGTILILLRDPDAQRPPPWPGRVLGETFTVGNVLWQSLRPTHHWSFTGALSVLGPVEFHYLPIGIRGPATVPVFPADVAAVERCFNGVFARLAAVLKDNGFEPLAQKYYGVHIPLRVFFYDETTSPTTLASSGMAHRSIMLPTATLRAAANDCLDTPAARIANAPVFSSIAHELFHLVFSSYAAPFDDTRRFADGMAEIERKVEVAIPVKGSGGGITYRAHDWIIEATARYFETTLFPSAFPERVRLYSAAAYPLHGPAFDVWDGKIYDVSYWHAYERWFFIKFLLDQEDRTETGGELRRLAALLAGIGAEMRAQIGHGPAHPIRAVEAYMTSRGLSWFHFFREHAFLHGCKTTGECTIVEGDSRPFSRGPADGPDFFGATTFDEGAHWRPLALRGAATLDPPDRPYRPAPAEWPPPKYQARDDGRAIVHAKACFFDSSAHSYHYDPHDRAGRSARSLVRPDPKDLPTRIDLPRHIEAPASGARIDFTDDLDHSRPGTTYRWGFQIGDNKCPETLRYELWERDGANVRRLHADTLANRRYFDIEIAAPPVARRSYVLLLGNDHLGEIRWSPPGAAQCMLTTAIDVRAAVCPAPRSAPWKPAATPGTSADLLAVAFGNESTAYAGGKGGVIVKTSDGGLTWKAQSSGTTGPINDLAFAGADHGLAIAGNVATSKSQILRTADGGTTWHVLDEITERSICPCDRRPCAAAVGEAAPEAKYECKTPIGDRVLQRIRMTSRSSAVISTCCTGDVLTTSDGGQTWKSVRVDGGFNSMSALGLAGSRGIAAGAWGNRGAGIVFATSDGGATWAEQRRGTDVPILGDLATLDGVRAFARSGVRIHQTADAGRTWTSAYAPPPSSGVGPFHYDGIFVHESGAVLAAGGSRPRGPSGPSRLEAGLITESSPDRTTWVDHIAVAARPLHDVAASCTAGCAVGDRGTIICRRP